MPMLHHSSNAERAQPYTYDAVRLGPFRRTYNRSLPDWALPYSLPWVEDCSYYREEHAICV